MVKLILGRKGSGKTKQMIELCNAAAKGSDGVVICMEHGKKLKYDVTHKARLIDTIPYRIQSYQLLRGFITGLYAGNYDIRDVFIDSLFKISGDHDMRECAKFLDWCESFGKENEINFAVSVSAPVEDAPEDVVKYADN